MMMAAATTAVQDLLVGDEWTSTTSSRAVRSPYSGETIATVAWGTPDHARAAIDAASTAMLTPLPAWERASILEQASQLIAQRNEEFALTICNEAGKPIALARVEAQRAVETLRAAAVVARTLAGDMVPMDATPAGVGKLAFTLREPAGVVAAITPFNFPLNLVAHKVAPALAAGCATVLKPSAKTPMSAFLLASVLLEAGLPAGWLNVITGPPADLVEVFADDERVRVITFTGSAANGWKLRERAAMTKVLLELGNATPVIVAADADLTLAADRLGATAFAHAGQSCVSVQRVYAERPVYERLVELLAARAAALSVGDPTDEAVDVGPLINADARARVLAWLAEAREQGAQLVTGDPLAGLESNGAANSPPLLRPTVVAGLTPEMRISHDEVFGPVVGVAPYDTLDAAIELCNDSPYGLQSAIFTSQIDAALAAARRLRFGSVLVNESPSFRADQMPYGGVKSSGTSKEGPLYAAREMTEERLVVLPLPGV